VPQQRERPDRGDPPRRHRGGGDERREREHDHDPDRDDPVIAGEEAPHGAEDGPRAAHGRAPRATGAPTATRPACAARTRRSWSRRSSAARHREDPSTAGTIASRAASPPGQCAPAPSAPQNSPKEVSITPTANFSAFSGTRASGARTATPAATTT